MLRRKFMQGIAAVFGLLFVPKVALAVVQPKLSAERLVATRYLLLPGLWGHGHENPHLEFDIVVNFKYSNLIVNGYNRNTKEALGFAITKHSIIDETYKASFNPCLIKLVELLA